MAPKFKNPLAWEQADLLMQPAFIRILDNIRKYLDQSSWTGSYEEIQIPYPGYLLCLTYDDQSVKVDLWNLCFQLCFRDYLTPMFQQDDDEMTTEQEVEIDTSLLDETGEVDWHRLETKAQQIVQQLFASLPMQ